MKDLTLWSSKTCSVTYIVPGIPVAEAASPARAHPIGFAHPMKGSLAESSFTEGYGRLRRLLVSRFLMGPGPFPQIFCNRELPARRSKTCHSFHSVKESTEESLLLKCKLRVSNPPLGPDGSPLFASPEIKQSSSNWNTSKRKSLSPLSSCCPDSRYKLSDTAQRLSSALGGGCHRFKIMGQKDRVKKRAPLPPDHHSRNMMLYHTCIHNCLLQLVLFQPDIHLGNCSWY